MIKIGIDPDINKSGFAINYGDEWYVESLSHHKLLEKVKSISPSDSVVYIEAGWLNKKANFRAFNGSKSYGESIALKVGRNQGTGIVLASILEDMGYVVNKIRPMRKLGMKQGSWTPKGRKMFDKLTKGFFKRINDDCRDAVLLVL